MKFGLKKANLATLSMSSQVTQHRLRVGSDGVWRHGWCTKLCYMLKMHRGINGMFSSSSCDVPQSIKIRGSATTLNCWVYQWPRACENQRDDLVWPAIWRALWGSMLNTIF